MPMMGGALAVPGQMLGGTRASDLSPMGKVYGYRSLMKSLMLGLGADIRDILIDDEVFDDFLVA